VFNIGPTELIVILVIALIVFGPKRLPEISKTVGKSLREFRKATEGIRGQIEEGLSGDEEDEEQETATGQPGDTPSTGTVPQAEQPEQPDTTPFIETVPQANQPEQADGSDPASPNGASAAS